MIITFFGHRDFIGNEMKKEQIKNILNSLSGKEEITLFFGGYGNFDSFCLSVAKEMYKKKKVRFCYITPYINEAFQRNHLFYLSKDFDEIIYPQLEKVPLRFAISYRNKYMIDESDFIIFYVKNSFGGAYEALKYAKKKNKNFINTAQENRHS